MEKSLGYAFSTTIDLPFEQAVEKVKESLKTEGFGVLTEIDIQATLKNKLDVGFRKYIILGACNPPFAHKSLQADPNVGLLLPCNVIAYENDEGAVFVAAINPSSVLSAIDNDRLAEVAGQVSEKLRDSIERLTA